MKNVIGNKQWKALLLISGIVILAMSTIYSYFLTSKLIEGEKGRLELVSQAFLNIKKIDKNSDHGLYDEIFQQNKSIPMIWVDIDGAVLMGVNFGDKTDSDKKLLEKELARIKRKGTTPIPITQDDGLGGSFTQHIYYKHSRTLRLLTWFPLFQLLLISSFVAIGYLMVTSARRAEQNRVWAGLAKETAHQLGTPISAMMAWVQLLETTLEETDENREILDELDKDVNRLNLIAERFSKVGSKPELSPMNIKDLTSHALDYMKRRASRQIKFIFREDDNQGHIVMVNPPLFEWVIENLMRNALDAMQGKGNIVVNIYEQPNHICLDISDTGKGIPANKHKKIFEPGYSTKKRGWGLGLSLVKRIVENYHKGHIFIKESRENVGTTFTIQLPKPKVESGI